ncbi:MAG TPA: XdhC family protein [Nocardioides sp.]|uniref:XdhC family protein n=1 Tax=Nocardioides sp. TaxID=35761 RepID=UPI002E313D21|nr:XdhC family protein [Nocardioides sp.]HEX3929408.1 XdhC family protein [Nocardioides sp.]
MYDIALTVAACLRSGTRVHVSWVVGSDLTLAGGAPLDPNSSLALTPGGGRVGSLCAGALDQQLAEHASVLGETGGRVVRVAVGELEAEAFGLAGAGTATAVVLNGELLPAATWELLQERQPLRVRLAREGDELTAAALQDPDGHEAGSSVNDLEVVTTCRPVPTVVLAGGGPVLAALEQMAPLLGWRAQRASDADTARALVVGLGPGDAVVLAMHDVELAGPVLASTLDGRAGYVAALGSRAMQQSRETWLSGRGIEGLERIHTPAGLDIGADGPAQVAVAILAQAIAERSGRAQAKA